MPALMPAFFNVLHPTLLAAGLAAVAVPILIHLLLRRKFRPMPWAAMRFVQIAQTNQRRRRRIEQILLLIARCLLIAALAFGVARPFFGEGHAAGETTLVLVIDDGLTSSATAPNGTSALDAHKAEAVAEIERLSSSTGDRVAVITMASPPRALISPATSDLAAARRAIESVRSADSIADVAGAMRLANESTGATPGPRRVVVLSDWRAGSLAGLEGDGLGGQQQPLGSAPSGAASTQAVVLSSPATGEDTNLRIRRFEISRATILNDDTPAARQALIEIDRVGATGSAVRGEVTVSLAEPDAGDRAVSVSAPFEIRAGTATTSVSIEIPAHARAADGRDSAAVAIATLGAPPGMDSIAGDSVARVALRFVDGVTVGVVRARGLGGGGIPAAAWITAALRPADTTPVRVRDLSPAGIDETALIGLDLVAVARPDLLTPGSWENLNAFADAGGTLVVFVPDGAVTNTWTDELASRYSAAVFPSREAVELDPPETLESGDDARLFSMLGSELDALATSVRVSRVLPIEIEQDRVALRTETGRPVLSRLAPSVWVFTVGASASWSDLPARPLFVPVMQELARRSPTRTIASTVTAGRPMPDGAGSLLGMGAVSLVPIEEKERPQDASEHDASDRFAPRSAGGRAVRSGDGPVLGVVAVNADPAGGETTPLNTEIVASRLAGVIEPGSYRWSENEAGEKGGASFAEGDFAWLAFAAAGLLAILESVIAASASRRSGAPASSRIATNSNESTRSAA